MNRRRIGRAASMGLLAALVAPVPTPASATDTVLASTSLPDASIDANGPKGAATPVPSGPLDSVRQVPLLADWGPRKRLADAGILLGARDVLEPAGNLRGYKGSGATLINHLDLDATLDLGKLGVIADGTVRFVITDRLGDGINVTRTGAYIQNQAFYGQGRNVRFNEGSYEQTFFNGRLALKGGFYPMGNDFGKLPYTCNFTNNGNCGHPLGPIYSSGWRDDPTGQWGGRIKWADYGGWYVQAGAYDVNTIRKTPGHGFDFGFRGTIGTFIPVEIGYVHGKTPTDYAGTYKITVYYDTSRAPRLGVPGAMTSGRSGFILQAAQQIWKPHPDTVRGIAIFGVWTRADRKTGLLPSSYEAGTSWRGVLASRPDDILSLSWTRVDVNSRVRAAELLAPAGVQSNEELWELNYGVQVRPYLLVRPSVQYVVRPGAYSDRPNSFVFTGHVQLAL